MPTILALKRIAVASIEALAAQGDKASVLEVIEHAFRVTVPHVADPAPRPQIVKEQEQ